MFLLRTLASLIYFNFICLVLCDVEGFENAESHHPVYNPVFVEMVNNLTSMSNDENRRENINVPIDITEISNDPMVNLKDAEKEISEMTLKKLSHNDTLDKDMNNIRKEKIKLIFPTSSFKEKLNLNISKSRVHSQGNGTDKSTNSINQNLTAQNISLEKSTMGHNKVESSGIASMPTPLVKLIHPFKNSEVMRRTSEDLNSQELTHLEQTVVNEMIKKYSALKKNYKNMEIINSRVKEVQQPKRWGIFNNEKTMSLLGVDSPSLLRGFNLTKPGFGLISTDWLKAKMPQKVLEYPSIHKFRPGRKEQEVKPISTLPIISPPSGLKDKKTVDITNAGINTSDLQVPTTGPPDNKKEVFTIDPDTKEVIFDSGIVSIEFLHFVNEKYNEALAKYNTALTNYKVYQELYNKAKEMGTI
ncbi:uncharacterized protein LOC106661446 [Cimex lectularius]|uniref:Uncharacterized protein n=1 Tax=Cimex lectularius TaxID=79782 RepID=A0A8I6R7K5_CIMLE|nr:uncharacterized protein LOC106661446 [Cimex lectularius]